MVPEMRAALEASKVLLDLGEGMNVPADWKRPTTYYGLRLAMVALVALTLAAGRISPEFGATMRQFAVFIWGDL